MTNSVNVNGTWKNIANIWVNVQGTWKVVTKGWVNVQGTWKQFFGIGTAPTIISAPVVSRNSVSSYVYSTTDGTWSGSATISYTYQWYYYNASVFPYTFTISGATSSSYTSSSSYVGYTIYCIVTATNSAGNSFSQSNLVTITTAISKPTISTYPVVTRNSTSTYIYSTDNGAWTGSPTSYKYQWYYYTVSGPYGTTTTISGATSSSYTSSSTYVGSYIYCGVIATNAAGDSIEATGNLVLITTAGSPPTIPTSLTATTTRYDGVNLEFSGSTGAVDYDIFWNTAASAYPSTGASADFLNKTSPFLDTAITSGTTRWYWVRGSNTLGKSNWYPYQTNGITGTRPTFVNPGTPTSPVNNYINQSPTGTYNYTCSWTATTTGSTPISYYIQVFGANSATGGTAGSGGSYVGTFGLNGALSSYTGTDGGGWTGTTGSYKSSYPWNYFYVYAVNYDGTSYYPGSNSTNSVWR